MPLLTDSSAVIAKLPASLALRRCVPPQNSMEYCRHLGLEGSASKSLTGTPTDTTRTIGGYFSPNTARKPWIFNACSCGASSA